MIDLELPLELAAEPPAFINADSASDWLAQLPLANATQAQAALARQLELLAGTALPLDQRLRIMEVMREPVLFVQLECLRRFSARPLPLHRAEQAAYEASLTLWHLLENNYLLCLQNSLARQLPDRAALAAQRAVAAKSGELMTHIAAGVVAPAAFWSRLHQIFRAAEALQITLRTVFDGQNTNPETTLAAAYVEPLLLATAQPLELAPRQIDLVAGWARRWAARVSILGSLPRDAKTPPLTVNLAGGEATSSVAADPLQADWRWLEMTDLRKSMKHKLLALAAGESPNSLNLGNDCTQPECEELLQRVYRLWCKQTAASAREQQPTGPCEVATGFEPIHFFLSGDIFHQPGEPAMLSKREHEEIATFGGIVTRHRDEHRQKFSLETWQARAIGVADLQLTRDLQQPVTRIGRGQLLALRMAGASNFMLAVARSVTLISDTKSLGLGLRLLPGTPTAVALRTTGLAAGNDSFCQGFRLPAMELLQEPASILMPSGHYRGGRIIETYSDCLRQIKLTRLLERGADFERASFDWV